jgi:hypothetical protein
MTTSSSRPAGATKRGRRALRRRLRRWRKYAGGARRRLAAAPRAVRIGLAVAAILAVFAAANFVYQVARKPSELLFPVGRALDKPPAETWRHYAPLFRAHATASITPELLAALAQVEATGNPAARTYWRWRLSANPFALYQPASSAVGLYQMTDGAFAEARRYCVRSHEVVEEGCWFNALYTRLLPSHAVELAAIYLDRNVAAVLERAKPAKASAPQKQDLAAMIHLCGAGPAEAFARRGFQAKPGERCGVHDVASYLARVNAMKRRFQRLAAEG